MSKYRSIKTELDGMTFDSRKEARRYAELKMLERCKEISDLARQVKFILIPKQDGESECSYYADFTYREKDGTYIVEDVKSDITRRNAAYIIKRKLMLERYGIRIKEV